MKKNLWTKALSMLLALVMVVGMIPATTIAAFADGVPETLVTSLTELYSGDETHAREDLEALSAAGLLGDDGKLVDLDIREGGESVELSALAERIANGEEVGEITVNGNAATAEQITQIQSVSSAIEIAELLDEEIDVTDEHVENLESLLTGIQNGSVDLEGALESGELSLSKKKTTLMNTGLLGSGTVSFSPFNPVDASNTLTLSEDGMSYIGPYINGTDYDANHAFAFPDRDIKYYGYYYTDSWTSGNGSTSGGTVSDSVDKYKYIDWDGAKWGVDDGGYAPVVTVVLPLNTSEEGLQNWIGSESESCLENGKGIAMTLPVYGETYAKFYMTSMYFVNSAKLCYPVYVVTNASDEAVALAGRFAAKENPTDHTRKDTLSIHMTGTMGVKTNDIPAYENWTKDAKGYYHFDGSANGLTAPLLSGKTYQYFVGPAAMINRELYITRKGGYEDLGNGVIRLKNPANPDFPYVLFDYTIYIDGDEENYYHPELQRDVELLCTEDYYQALVNGAFYMEGDDLRLSYQVSDRVNFTFAGDDYVRWVPNSEYVEIEPLNGNREVRVKILKSGENMIQVQPLFLSFYAQCIVSNSDDGYTADFYKDDDYPSVFLKNYNSMILAASDGYIPNINFREGSNPNAANKKTYLDIPYSSRIRETLVGMGATVPFVSNVTQVDENTNGTEFQAKLYQIADSQVGTWEFASGASPVATYTYTSTKSDPLTHVTIPEGALSEGAYAVVISATFSFGGESVTRSTTAYLKVKQGPAKVTLNKLDSYGVVKGSIPDIKYTVTSAASNVEVKYTIQGSGDAVSNMQDASGGTIPFTPGDFEGLKKAYTITVYARNKDTDPWSVDSMLLTVYNANPLKLILQDVPFGEVGGATGGKADTTTGSKEAGSSLVMDNTDRINSRLATEGLGNGYQVNYDDIDFETLRRDVNLQEVISANYGSGAWGVLSDKMNWAATEGSGDDKALSDDVTLNHKQGGEYKDIRDYSYTSYIPTTNFLITATDDKTAAAPVTVTATHAATGLQTSVDVTVNTLQNKLYLFRFNPKALTDVVYTNGNDEQRSLQTDANGELAVYEPAGIKSDVVVSSKDADGVTYIGTVQNRDLVSGEQNIVKLELYPCNNLKLVPISNTTLTFLLPNGKPYTGSVTLRGGVYNGDNYCPDAELLASNEAGAARYQRTDMKVTTDANGKATVWFDPTEFGTLTTNIRYVFEYRFDSGYQPGYVIIDPLGNTAVESVINLKTLRGSGKVPTIVRQDYQQFLNGKTPTDYTRNVMDYTGNIGISPNFSKAELYTDVVMLGETVGTDANGYSTYSSDNAVSFALYTTEGKKLTGQTELTGATQITKLSDLNNATFFVFPFSAVPMLRSTYTMTGSNLTADGITDKGETPTPTARIKAVFTRGDMTVASVNMPFGVTNVSSQPNLSSSTNGAKAVGEEVQENLKDKTDVGSIFKSINVNDMIRKGFVFLGNLTGKGGDSPINMMILPTADPATFRIITFVGANQRSNGNDDGVSVNFNSQDLAEDMTKFKKEMEEMNKKKDKENDSGGSGSMQFNFYGTIILEAHAGVADGKWNIAFRGGNVGTNVKGKYEWGQTFMCGPYPAFISFEVGFHADLEVAFGNKAAARAMLLDAALGVSIEAFAGLGFDLSLVAIQVGIYGQIGADVNFLLLTPSDADPSTGTKLTISGEIGLKLKVKLLFISYTQKFASTGFNWTKKWNNYDTIKNYWTNQGFGQFYGTTRSGRAYTMYLFDDGSTIVEIEGGAELENRDYLELEERSWMGGANSGVRLMRSASPITNAITNVQTNSYPYSHPAFTDDGEMFLYVSDNDNASDVQSVVSYAVKNDSSGYDNKGVVDAEDTILADLDVVASGTKDTAFAAWVKQVETPKRANKNAEVTNDELGMMFNATEIYASTYSNSTWTTTRLTDNCVADMSPTVASSGSKAIVAWRSMNASSMTANGTAVQDITAMFDVENNINYSIYNGGSWTTAKVAYNGNAGTVNAIDSAMLSDGTAILVYTVRTGEDVTTTETFYTVINATGAIVTTGRLTNDDYTDTNAQVTAVNANGGYFVLGWYSEHDAGEGMTSEYDDQGNATEKAVVAHDIRLARINANGSYDIDFPESIGGTGDTGISSDFHFSAPAGNTDLKNVSVVWSQRMDSDKAEDAGKYELNAVRFYQANDVTGLTAPTNIATTGKNYTIDRFDAYTDSTGAIHAIILGTDYSTIEGIEKYDSIDLDKVTKELGEDESNSDSPNNLDILDGEAISSLKLATGTFPAIAADVAADTNIDEVIPGFTTPVQFTVTNTGTGKLETVTAQVGAQSKNFTVNLLPNQSATLLMTYNVPEGAVSDVNYTVKSGNTTLGSGTLTLNRPDVGISGIKLLREYEGKRDIQVMLANGSEIPLMDSGKTVKLAFYKDPLHKKMIGSEVSISGNALAQIDAGTYTTVRTLEVTDITALTAGEIPKDGITVYARAWVADTEEPNTYNNDNYISFTGLLARNNGEKLTTDTSLEENEGNYTVYADIRNNSMQETNIGIPVAAILDSNRNVIAQKPFQNESLTLTKEQSRSLSVSFAAADLNGKTPAEAVVGTAYTVTFDVNGGTGTFESTQTGIGGHITLPTTAPTPPTGKLFSGWYTQQTGGDKITESTEFTENTTVYAQYVTHQHNFTYSANGATITATCANTTDCPLADSSYKATLTIAAPDSNTYTGSAIAAKIIDANGIQGDAKVLYAAKGENGTYGEDSETVPLNVGTYRASITLGTGDGAATANVEYEIKNATLTGVSVTQNGTLTYTGSAQTPQVTTAATAVNGQNVTFTYSLTEDGEYGDMPTFTNANEDSPTTVFFKASAPYHDTASGSFTVTVNKATLDAPAAPTLVTATANKIVLTEFEGCEYSKDGTNWQESPTFTGLTKNTQYTFYQRFKKTANYNESPSSVAATISTTDHNHDWSFTADGAAITATCGNTDGGHSGELSATMTIAAPTSLTYDGTAKAATVTNGIENINTPTIVYNKKNGEELNAAPTAAGIYTASITLTNVNTGDGQTDYVTASVEYTINPAQLTITANNKTITYGVEPTNDGVTYDGFVNGETPSVLTGTLDYDYSYTKYGDVSSASNNYTITPKGLTSDNYTITFVPGTLTVEQKEVGLEWANLSFTYDGQSHKPTATANGTVNNDAISVTVTGEQTNASSTAYTATASELTGEKADNYKLPTANTTTFTIGKMNLTITADSDEKVYDAKALTKNSYTNTGLAFNDAIESVTITGSQTVKGESSNVPSAAVIKNGNGDNVTANYNITYANGKLKVTAKPITITAESAEKVYDATALTKNAANDYTTNTALAEGDTITSVTITGTQTNVGTSDNVPSAAVIKNNGTDVTESYAITYENGTLEVTPKAVTITANDNTKVYDGTALTEGGFTATPLETTDSHTFTVAMTAGSTITNFGTQPNVIATVDGTAITTGTETAVGNYLVTTVDGTLSITKLEIKGALVKLDAFEYDAATVPTAKFVNDSEGANGTIVQGDNTKHVTYYYQATAFLKSQTDDIAALDADKDTIKVLGPTTFEPGKHYVLAVISGDNYTDTYVTQSVFEVTKNTENVRDADITAPEVDGTKVTVDEADRAKSLEYSLDGTTWKPVTLNENGEFTAEWANPVTDAELKLRETADESYAKPSASVAGTKKITTTTFTVTYDANGGVKAPDAVTVTSDRTVTVSGKANMTRKGYTFTGWNTETKGTGTAYKAGDKLSTGITLYAQWEANTYKVRFNANGGTGKMDDELEFTYDAAQALTQNAFARDEYNFLGWSLTANGSVQYQDKQSVKNLAENGTVTLYAVWAKDVYKITGKVISEQEGKITVKLVQGNNIFGKTETNEANEFALNGVPAGTYNLVITQGEITKEITKTVAVIITDSDRDLGEITMPSGNASSVIDVKSVETPAIVVGGLDKLAEDEIVEGRKVKVTIAIEAQNEKDAGEAGEAIVKESRAQNAEFIDFTVTKAITNKGTEPESVETMTETSKVLELIIPFSFSGKSGIKLYRFHNGEVQNLEQAKGEEVKDGTYSLDQKAGAIHVYASKFSTYAITYSNYSGGFVSDFETVIAETEHGTITVEPQKAQAGKEVVITATPDAGYKLAELTVKDANGNEVELNKNEDGTYSFKQPNGKVTIEGKFIVKFVDVPENSYYAKAVDWAVLNGITNGVDETHFAPDATCTRAQAVTFLWRALGCPEPTATKSEFTDVAEGAFYFKAVLWAAENGVTNGYGDGKFGVNDTVNRAQMVTFMARAMKGKAKTAESFTDVPEGSFYADAAAWAKENGISDGIGDNKFGGEIDCLRAQIVTMLYRYFVK